MKNFARDLNKNILRPTSDSCNHLSDLNNAFTLNAVRSETIFGNLKSFKNDEKCFLFHLRSSLRSQF